MQCRYTFMFLKLTLKTVNVNLKPPSVSASHESKLYNSNVVLTEGHQNPRGYFTELLLPVRQLMVN